MLIINKSVSVCLNKYIIIICWIEGTVSLFNNFLLGMQDDADWSTLGVKDVSGVRMQLFNTFFFIYNQISYIILLKQPHNLIWQGQKLMMMGTADEILKSPEKGPVFVEDLPEEEQVVAVVSFDSFPLYIHIISWMAE